MRFLGSAFAALALASPPSAAVLALGHGGFAAVTSGFVGRSGAHLTLDGKPFRFGGANIEWLGVSDYGPASPRQPRYPTHAEVDTALATARRLGARVVRSQSLTDSVGCAVCLEPTPHSFNDAAFAHTDYAIAAAGERGLKVIATIVGDDAAAGGSGCVYLAWRGYQIPSCSLIHMDPFFTDPQVIADVEEHIAAVLNHVNVYTHVAYRNDPTILGWDLMNGGGSPPAWTKTIADYVRSIDPHHLILSDASNAGLRNVDACVSFIYPHWHQGMEFAQPRIDACARAHKPYLAYEYGWDRTNWPTLASFRRFLTRLAGDHEIAGDAFWALELRSRPIPADVTDPQEAAAGESGEWWALTVPPRTTLVSSAADMQARTKLIAAHNRTMASSGRARR
jgi:mannan endo-1,4-beta-mannosidase